MITHSNNAGIMHPEDDNALNTSERIWDLTMNSASLPCPFLSQNPARTDSPGTPQCEMLLVSMLWHGRRRLLLTHPCSRAATSRASGGAASTPSTRCARTRAAARAASSTRHRLSPSSAPRRLRLLVSRCAHPVCRRGRRSRALGTQLHSAFSWRSVAHLRTLTHRHCFQGRRPRHDPRARHGPRARGNPNQRALPWPAQDWWVAPLKGCINTLRTAPVRLQMDR